MTTNKRIGRGKRSIETQNNHQAMDKLLVEGELLDDGNGKIGRVFPTSTDVASRFNVSNAWVSKFAHKHKCFERRAAIQKATRDKTRKKLERSEANRIAFDSIRQLELCDSILSKYAAAIDSREVGNVTAADINAMVRLRHFIRGDADSRAEIASHTVTLEMMEEAHRNLRETIAENSDEECGVVKSFAEARKSLSEKADEKSEINCEINQAEGI